MVGMGGGLGGGEFAPGSDLPPGVTPDMIRQKQQRITNPTLLKVAQEMGYDPSTQDAGSLVNLLTTTIQPQQVQTFEQRLNEAFPVTAVDPFAVEQAPRPSMRDRIRARRATRGSANPINPVMDWLSGGTDWSEGRKANERPILANLGSKLKSPKAWLNALSFVNPQVAMLNRAINIGQAFKKDPKEAGLGLLGQLIGSKFGGRGQNIFNVARGIRGGDTFKQGLGNLFRGELLGSMGRNRDVGEGILSMLGGKDPSQAFGDFAIGRAGRQMDPMQQRLFGAGVETMQGRPMGEAFGGAFKGMAGSAFKKHMFQRAYQKGGRPLVRKLQATLSLMGSGPG